MSNKVHPLHDEALVITYIRENGEYPGDRRTGRTTALALKYIAEAIGKPSVRIYLRDHVDTKQASDHLARKVQDIVRELRLKHLKVTSTQTHPGLWTYPYLIFSRSEAWL